MTINWVIVWDDASTVTGQASNVEGAIAVIVGTARAHTRAHGRYVAHAAYFVNDVYTRVAFKETAWVEYTPVIRVK